MISEDKLASLKKDIDIYLREHELAGELIARPTARIGKFTVVLANPQSAEAWWSLLLSEEIECNECRPSSADRCKVTLLELYRWATQLVPRQTNHDVYVKIWVGFARQQWSRSAEDARDTFKTLKSQHIGEQSALLYCEWASLEAKAGDKQRAASILSKGIKEGAQPASRLKTLEQDILAPYFVYQPFWALKEQGAPGLSSTEEGFTTHKPTGLTSQPTPSVSVMRPLLSADVLTDSTRRHAIRGGSISLKSSSTENTSSEEATVSLQRLPSGKLHTPAVAAPEQGEDTVILKIPSSTTSADREGSVLKPRKIGMLGKAVRIVPSEEKVEAMPAAQKQLQLTPESDSDLPNRKRKADYMEAALKQPSELLAGVSTTDGHVEAAYQQAMPSNFLGRAKPTVLAPIPEVFAQETLMMRFHPNKTATAEDGTAPIAMSQLASKVHSGGVAQQKQNLGHGKIVLSGDGSISETGNHVLAENDTDPTVPLPAPGRSYVSQASTFSRLPTCPSIATASAAQEKQVQIDSAGNIIVRGFNPKNPQSSLNSKAVSRAQNMTQSQQLPPRPAMLTEVGQQRRILEDDTTIVVRNIIYTKLECVGRGGSSKVYKVMAPNRKIFALKRIRLNGRDSEAANGFLDEITLLNKLRGKGNIIQLVDAEVHRSQGIIYMVLEYGDIDLARLLQRQEKTRQERTKGDRSKKLELDENFIRLYWEQMLFAVSTIHDERIVHSDLKPANFLVVEGQLKLIDFGIAKAIQSDTTSIARESQVGTLNYMSPEAILGGSNNIRGVPAMKVGRPSDIWSLGCILYQMVYGHTPFSHLPFIQKMHAIIDPNHVISFPPLCNSSLIDVMQRCLDRNPKMRITMKELLDHPFLRPTEHAAATPRDNLELSKEQLHKLLVKVSAAGSVEDIGNLSEQLFRQLSSGLSPEIIGRQKSATSKVVEETHKQENASTSSKGEAADVRIAHKERLPLQPLSCQAEPREDALEAVLRKGLQRFTFEENTD